LKKSKLSREESVDAHTSTEKGIVIRYQIAAVPIARGLTGVRAFALMSPPHYFMKERLCN